jgi:aldehyde:ferredoxin oxidoreductase
VVEINFYCDAYGIDTISFGTGLAFAMDCFETGLIDKTHTGGLELTFGNRLSALEVLHQMAKGEGFGKVVGQGVRRMKESFSREYGADEAVMQDIGMEAKGLEFSEYMTKESLAQQGGYGLALKGPQHDEAWLIFLDMVHNYMPTFEQKAEALHWFPMFRTWFSLCGLCKLPWNDIVPEDNKDTLEPAKIMKHVEWYARYFSAVTGRKSTPEDLITMSEAVYNFQRLFNLKMGFGRREHDGIPYRAAGPVTAEEYESRRERYDQQLTEKHGVDIEGKSTEEKVKILRRFREERYENLKDAVYKRRGWTAEGIPKIQTVKRLKIDFPEVLELLKASGVTE